MLVIGGIAIFYNLTTKNDRTRWGWNLIGFILFGATMGFIFAMLKAGSITE